jgi:hypothetical protein
METLRDLRVLVSKIKSEDDVWMRQSLYIEAVEKMDKIEKELQIYRDLNLERDLMS